MRYCANPGRETAANSGSRKEQRDWVCKKEKTQEERPVSSQLCTAECELGRERRDGKAEKRKTEIKWQIEGRIEGKGAWGTCNSSPT